VGRMRLAESGFQAVRRSRELTCFGPSLPNPMTNFRPPSATGHQLARAFHFEEGSPLSPSRTMTFWVAV